MWKVKKKRGVDDFSCCSSFEDRLYACSLRGVKDNVPTKEKQDVIG